MPTSCKHHAGEGALARPNFDDDVIALQIGSGDDAFGNTIINEEILPKAFLASGCMAVVRFR